jgi:hypothetical protein
MHEETSAEHYQRNQKIRADRIKEMPDSEDKTMAILVEENRIAAESYVYLRAGDACQRIQGTR